MSKPKLVQFLILLFFVTAVTIGIFFLVSIQLKSFMRNTGVDIVVTDNTVVRVPTPPLLPTATMFDLTLDMLETVETTATLAVSVTLPAPQLLGVAMSTTTATGIVNTDLVNIRSYPSLVGEVVGQARQGTQLQVLETSNDGQWVQVCCPLGTSESSIQSWISAEFVDVTPQSTPSTSLANVAVTAGTSPGASATVTSDNHRPNAIHGIGATVTSAVANVRSGPATSYAIVGQANEQTQITITGRNEAGTWWRICCPPGVPSESWISAELVTLAVSQAEAMAQAPVITVAPAPTAIATSAANNPTPVLSAP